jgi:hypothetical protein
VLTLAADLQKRWDMGLLNLAPLTLEKDPYANQPRLRPAA